MATDTIVNDTIGYKNIEVQVECPTCSSRKILQLPVEIIQKTSGITTISVPIDLVCMHSFQVFIDKQYKIRGYQKIDFDFIQMEMYSDFLTDSVEKEYIPQITQHSSFSKMVDKLREFVQITGISGCALLEMGGHVIYSSLLHRTLINLITEFENRDRTQCVPVKKIYFELDDGRKICTEYTDLENHRCILIIILPSSMKIGMGILYLKDLSKRLNKLIIDSAL